MNEASILCIKFNFGVPLEDIFPSNGVHPRLLNLFHQTTLAFEDSCLSLHDILNDSDVSLDEALDLKDAAVGGKLVYREDISASSFFWLLRHFLGLLPLPLFPRFTDGRKYSWEYLSKQCKLRKLRGNCELESEIFWWIHKLPKENFLLIEILINFLRRLCLKRPSLKKLDSSSVKSAVLYFSSSLFWRPYTPGFVTESESLFYSLLYYLIIRWPRIKDVRYNLNYKLSSTSDYEKLTIYNDFVKNRFIDCSCQTSSWLLTKKFSNEGFEETKQSWDYAAITEESSDFGEENKISTDSRLTFSEKVKQEEKEFLIEREKTQTRGNCNIFTSEKASINLVGREVKAKNLSRLNLAQKEEEEFLIEREKTQTRSNCNIFTAEKTSINLVGREVKAKNLSRLNLSQTEEDENEQSYLKEGEAESQFKYNISQHKESEEQSNPEKLNVGGDYSNYAEDVSYEEILEEKIESINSNNESKIFKEGPIRNLTPKIIKQKIVKANKSLINVFSKVNEKIKSKQDRLKAKSGSKLETCKYNLLEDSNITRVQSLHVNRSVKESPNIKYKKLMTL